MGLAHSPRIVTNGLVLYYDMGNTSKSWLGQPTTNLLYDNGALNSTFGNLVATVTVTNASSNMLRLTTGTTAGSLRVNIPLTKLANNQQYTMSYKYRFVTGGPTFSMTDFCDAALINNSSTVYNDYVYSSATTATGLTFNSTYRFMDFTVSANSVIDVWDFQLENLTYATPFVNGTRSNTQSIIDLTGRNTITASSLTYAANNTFSFNANGNYIALPADIGYTTAVSAFAWVKILGSPKGGFHIIFGPTYLEISIYSNGVLRTGVQTSVGRTVGDYGSGVADGLWHHVGFTYDGTNKNTYLDGNYMGTQATTGTLVSSFANRSMGIFGQADTTYGLNGIVHNTSVYNRALSAEEVKQNYNALRGRFGL